MTGNVFTYSAGHLSFSQISAQFELSVTGRISDNQFNVKGLAYLTAANTASVAGGALNSFSKGTTDYFFNTSGALTISPNVREVRGRFVVPAQNGQVLDIGGNPAVGEISRGPSVKVRAATYAMETDDYNVDVDTAAAAASAGVLITLPDGQDSLEGIVYEIADVGNNASADIISIRGQTGDSVGGASYDVGTTIATNSGVKRFRWSSGYGWRSV